MLDIEGVLWFLAIDNRADQQRRLLDPLQRLQHFATGMESSISFLTTQMKPFSRRWYSDSADQADQASAPVDPAAGQAQARRARAGPR